MTDLVSGVFRTTAWIFLVKILSTAFLTGGALLAARDLGPSGRGVLVLELTVTSFTVVLSSLGLNVAMKIHLVSLDRPVTLADCWGLGLLVCPLSGVASAGVALVALPLAHVEMTSADLVLTAVYGTLLCASLLLLALLNAFGFNARASTLDMLGSGVQFALILGLGLLGYAEPRYFIGAVAASLLVQNTLNVVVLARGDLVTSPAASGAGWGRLLKTGGPAVGWSLGQSLTFRLDRYLAGLLLTPADVGIYSLAATATELLRLMPYAVVEVYFYRLASKASDLADFARARRVLLAAGLLCAGGLYLVAPWAVSALAGPAFEPAVAPLRVLLLAELAMSSFVVDTAALAALGRVQRASVAVLAGLVTVTAADLVLIPSHGIVGAAWASVIGYWLMVGVGRLLLRRDHAASISPVASPA